MGQVLHESATTTAAVCRLKKGPVIVAFSRHTLLPLDDCLYALQATICDENEVEHRLTKMKHPWTNGQVERMNRTINFDSISVTSSRPIILPDV